MKRIVTKIDARRDAGRATNRMIKGASISARDPLAYAAALKILG